MESVWTAFRKPSSFPLLSEDVNVDAVVIGAGITGISCAFELLRKGLKVAVLEASEVAGGTTGESTGNLYSIPDRNLSQLVRKHGTEAMRLVIEARRLAIERIEEQVESFAINCEFRRVPWFLYAADPNAVARVEEELSAAKSLGLDAEEVELTYPFRPKKTIRVSHQAQFNARLFTQELAGRIYGDRCQIFERTSVSAIEDIDGYFRLTTHMGHVVRARYVIHATHTPKGVMTLQAFLGPYREYGVAGILPPVDFSGIYWGYHGGDNIISSRLYKRNGLTYLIVVGEPHKVGQKEGKENVERLKSFARQHFEIDRFDYEWSGQHYHPADGLPYIGRLSDGEFVATGFSTHGLVYGVMAAEMIGRQIAGPMTELDSLLSPRRMDLIKSLPNFIKENINVAAQYLRDWPLPADTKAVSEIAKGEGAVIDHNGYKLAVYRDPSGDITTRSAVCPHMKCIVHWNSQAKSWDCPCHGSRFDCKGKVLEGPALHDLSDPRET